MRGPGFRGDRALADQLRRASISVASNIAEGHGRGRRKEFARFLLIARGSCAEVKAQLGLALDSDRLSQLRHRLLYDMADHAAALISNLHTAILRQSERS